MKPEKKKKIKEGLFNTYLNNGLVIEEMLASEEVAPHLTYAEAFEVYIDMMKTLGNAEYYTVQEGRTITL